MDINDFIVKDDIDTGLASNEAVVVDIEEKEVIEKPIIVEPVKGVPEEKETGVVIEEEKEKIINYAKMMAEILAENKVLDSVEGIETFDDIVNIFNAKDEEIIDNYKNSLSPEIVKLIEVSSKGVVVDRVMDSILSIAEIESIKTKGDTESFKKIFMQSLKEDGYSEDYIKSRLETAEDTGTLKLEGMTAADRLLYRRNETIRKEEENSKVERQKQQEYYNKWMQDTETAINTILTDRYNINKNTQKEVLKSVLEPVEIVKQGGYDRPVSFLEKAISIDETLIAEINYLIMTNKIGAKAKENIIKASTSKGIDAFEKAIKDATIPKGEVDVDRTRLMSNFKLKL
jgi:hypothetical protein